MVGHIPIFSKAKDLLNVIGDVKGYRSSAFIGQVFSPKKGWRYKKSSCGGGSVMIHGSHLIYLLRSFFGEAKKVTASTKCIYSEVEDVIDNIQVQNKLVDGNRLAYKLREETLNTELKLYSLGLSSSDQIIRYQDQLSLAQRSTIQAIVDYNKAISRKNKILGTSLEKYNIKINSIIMD